jgi:hypothetical protein
MGLFAHRRVRRAETMCNEELQNLYSSQNIIMMIKSQRVIWASQEAYMGQKRNVYIILATQFEGKR